MVHDSLGVAIRLKDWVGVDNPVLQVGLLLLWRSVLRLLALGSSEDGEVGDHLLGVLRLSGTRLASDQHGLILGVVHHLLVGAVGSSEEMRWHLWIRFLSGTTKKISFKCHLVPPLVDIHLTSPLGVDGVPLVRVDDNL